MSTRGLGLSAIPDREGMVEYIVSKGLGIFIGLQHVYIWDKDDPSLEWTYETLKDAYEAVKKVEG